MDDPQALQTTYKEALTKLSEGKDGEAAQLLQKILESGKESADLYYYLGRAYIHQGNAGQASLLFLKSVARDRLDLEARQDLKNVQSKVEAGFATPMEHPYELAQTLASFVRPSEFLFSSSLLVLVFLGLHFKHQGSVALRRTLIGFALLLALLGAGSSLHQRVGVLKGKTPLLEAPIESAAVRRELPTGSRVLIHRKEALFSEISRGTLRGWVDNQQLVGTLD